MSNTGRIIQKFCAIAIIFIMTMADLVLIGAEFVSYAVNVAETNNSNVEFKAYFIEDNEPLETTATIDKNDLKIAIELGVKNDGYLSNAKLELAENSNFKFKTDTKSDFINSIDEQSITFKQINEGDSKKIEVGIEFTNLNEFDLDYLSKISTLNLTGTYVNSRNANTQINGSAELKLNWTYPENITSFLSSEIITNSTVKENESNKKIVQALITSKIENNSFPVKDTKIELTIPGEPETVTVHKRTTAATNGDQDFGTSNYTFENGKLTITIQNGQNDRIVWQKNVEDIFVVTIKYPENAEITNSIINTNSTITAYKDKELTKSIDVTISENKEKYASIKEIEMQNEISKGKIYAGENKEYKTKTEINVDYANILQKIEIQEKEVKALKNEEEKELPVDYKSIKFNKANIQSVLGNTWNITIKDQADNSKTISNETDTDEDGNILVTLETSARKINIETSKPENNGILKYEVTKNIVKTNYTREEIKALTKIKDSNKIIYTKTDDSTNNFKENATINLKETESKASLKVEPLTLTTSGEQEMHITAVLETDSEDRDLFKNPVVKIKLPKQINKISAQHNLMYGNGLQVSNFKINEENGQEVITINLTGEQKNYEGGAVKGATLNITARVELDKLATNSSEEVVMTYTNENAESYADNGQEKVNINIVSQNTMILTNNIEEYNISSLGKENDKEISLPSNSAAKNATVKMQIVNNEEAEISNVAILGKIANIEGKIDRTSAIRTNLENSKVYYTSVDNPTTSTSRTENNWKQTATNNSKYFLVVINSLNKGSKINLSYDINVKANLPFNIQTETFYKVSYTNSLNNANKEVESTKIIFTTRKVTEKKELKKELVAKVHGTEINQGDVVKAGEIITYTAKITNTGAIDINNLKLEAIIPQNTTLIVVNPNYPKYDEQEGEYLDGEEYFKKMQDKTTLTQENINIKSGQEYIRSFSVIVNENLTEEKNIEAKFIFTESDGNKDEKTFTNKISPATLKVICVPYFRKANTNLEAGINHMYGVRITNISNTEQKNIKVILEKSDSIEFGQIDWSIENIDESEKNDADSYEIQLENNNTLSFASIPAGKTLVVLINAEVKAIKENSNQLMPSQLKAQVRDNNGNTYRSNELNENIVGILATVESTSNVTTKAKKSGYVESGNKIKYVYKIKNIGFNNAENLTILNDFSKYLNVESLKINGENAKYEKESLDSDDIDYDIITIEKGLKSGEEIKIEIIGKVLDELPDYKGNLSVINNLVVLNEGIKIAEKSEKTYYIEVAQNSGGGNGGQNNGNQSYERYTISGTVWKDENNDGLRGNEEELLSGIKVYAIDVKTSKIATYQNEEITFTTGDDGTYYLENLQKGKYIVAFEYDTDKYMATVYQAEGVDESINSDAINASRVVNDNEIMAAFTDSINLKEDKIDIDLGLAEAKVFSLKLDKYISKIIVTNKNGAKTYNYKDSNLAKVEISSKELSGSTVIIEYKLKITNVGEIAGYAKSIVDHIPSSLVFNSSLNSDWYKKGNDLYTSSISDTLIEPGESQEITLTLTKKMTGSNTGLTNNKAEIESSYNSLGLPNTAVTKDKSGTQSEYVGSADAIIGVKTGTAISYIVLTLTSIIMIGGLAYLVNKKILRDKIKI